MAKPGSGTGSRQESDIAATPTEMRRRARNRSLRRDAAVLVVVTVGLALAWSVRLVPNEDLPAARTLTAGMDDVYRDVRAGRVELDTTPGTVGPGIEGVRLERPDGDRWVLTGEAGVDCYALWWDADGDRRVRTVPGRLPCAPSATLTSSRPGTFDRIGRVTAENDTASPWEPVLPDAWQLRVWFLPAMILGGGVGLSALVRMSIAMITGDTPAATRR